LTKNITLSADEGLIRRARAKAAREKRSLNNAFREWLTRYCAQDSTDEDYDALMKRLSHIRLHGPYTREEMNERR